MTLNNKLYDVLKWVALVLLPAVSTFYLAMASVWALPYPAEIAGTIAAIDVFLGVMLGISVKQYKNAYERTLTPALSSTDWIFSDKVYSALSWLAQIALPAVATLYFSLASFWHLPSPDQVVSTIMVIDTFLGMLLQFSSSQFYKSFNFIVVEK